MDSEVVSLATSRPTDQEVAADILKRLRAALEPVLSIMDEAASAGFLVRWGGLQPNAFGHHEVAALHLERHIF